MADSEKGVKGFVTNKKDMLYIVINYYEITDGKKVRRTKWISTKLKDTKSNRVEAEKIKEEQLHRFGTVSCKLDSNALMPELTHCFLEQKKRELANTTYSTYENQCKYIEQYFMAVKVKDIATRDINGFYDYLLIKGQIKKQGEMGLSVRSVKDVKRLLNTLFEFAIQENVIHSNPATAAVLNKSLVRNKEYDTSSDTFFDYEECERFLELCEGHILHELFYFTICFGLRRSEALGLHWDSVNLNNRTIVISHTVTKGTVVNYDSSVKSKSSYRTYPLNTTQYMMLRNIKERQEENRKIFGKSYIDTGYVFTHENGACFYPDYPSKEFRKLLKKDMSLPQNVHFHGLRASCVSWLAKSGVEMKQIQEWVGHKDIETTLKYYTKIKSEESKKAIAKMMEGKMKVNF